MPRTASRYGSRPAVGGQAASSLGATVVVGDAICARDLALRYYRNFRLVGKAHDLYTQARAFPELTSVM